SPRNYRDGRCATGRLDRDDDLERTSWPGLGNLERNRGGSLCCRDGNRVSHIVWVLCGAWIRHLHHVLHRVVHFRRVVRDRWCSRRVYRLPHWASVLWLLVHDGHCLSHHVR